MLRDENLLRPNNREGDHDKAEAKDAHEAEFLLDRNLFDIVDQLQRHGHDWKISALAKSLLGWYASTLTAEVGKDINRGTVVHAEIRCPNLLRPRTLREPEEVGGVPARERKRNDASHIHEERKDNERVPRPAVVLQLAEEAEVQGEKSRFDAPENSPEENYDCEFIFEVVFCVGDELVEVRPGRSVHHGGDVVEAWMLDRLKDAKA